MSVCAIAVVGVRSIKCNVMGQVVTIKASYGTYRFNDHKQVVSKLEIRGHEETPNLII